MTAVSLLLAAAALAAPAKHASRSEPAVPRDAAPAAVVPAGPEDLFHRAGAAYEAGRLPEALALYEKLAADGFVTAAVCYNLGNTQWRLGRHGLAILWYERARRLSPRDPDVRFNLKLARSSYQDEEAPWGEAFDRLLTPTELAWIVTALAWLLGGVAGWALWRDLAWPRWRRVVTVGFPALLLFAGWLGLRAGDLAAEWAVVSAPTAEVRSGPGDQFTVGFTAPEGQRALILNRRPGWVEIGVPSKSLKGWVADSAVAAI